MRGVTFNLKNRKLSLLSSKGWTDFVDFLFELIQNLLLRKINKQTSNVVQMGCKKFFFLNLEIEKDVQHAKDSLNL